MPLPLVLIPSGSGRGSIHRRRILNHQLFVLIPSGSGRGSITWSAISICASPPVLIPSGSGRGSIRPHPQTSDVPPGSAAGCTHLTKRAEQQTPSPPFRHYAALFPLTHPVPQFGQVGRADQADARLPSPGFQDRRRPPCREQPDIPEQATGVFPQALDFVRQLVVVSSPLDLERLALDEQQPVPVAGEHIELVPRRLGSLPHPLDID